MVVSRSGVVMFSPCMFGGGGGVAVVERLGGGDERLGASDEEALFDVESVDWEWVASCAAALAQVALLGSP
jgi:hypothetical protein